MINDDRIAKLLSEYPDLLTQYEQEFLDSIESWEGDLTGAQEETLANIYKRLTHCRRH